MKGDISVIIPAHNEQNYIARCLESVRTAERRLAEPVEIVVTIDADSWMSSDMLREISRRMAGGRHVGGGVIILPERMSLGILFSTMTFAPQLILKRSWAGMFWALRQTVDAVGGFNEALVSVEDVDFAQRLKTYGKRNGLRYGLIMRAYMVTSCRKFDQFGDWYFFRNRAFARRLLSGRDQEAANRFYYDVRQETQGKRKQSD